MLTCKDRINNQKININKMQDVRKRINVRLEINKKAPVAPEAKFPIINTGGTDMLNVSNPQNNVNPTILDALEGHLSTPRVAISTTDINYADHLIRKGKLKEARSVINNMKSVASSIDTQICDLDNWLASMEV